MYSYKNFNVAFTGCFTIIARSSIIDKSSALLSETSFRIIVFSQIFAHYRLDRTYLLRILTFTTYFKAIEIDAVAPILILFNLIE